MNEEGGTTGHGWTVVLRRRPARIAEGRPEGGYTEEFEIVCCYCGDDLDLDYREVSPQLQHIRGPYPIAVGIAAWTGVLRRAEGPGPGPREASRYGPSSEATPVPAFAIMLTALVTGQGGRSSYDYED